MNIQQTLSRHKKIALQFSGGRDSLACLYLLRDFWDDITVYFLNTGDMFPSTLEVIEKVKSEVTHFVEVSGNVQQTQSVFGIPSDIVPASSILLAKTIDVNADRFMITDRYTCCSNSIMQPMHQRMMEDGITLIIRGQKNNDRHKPSLKSGETHDGIEFFFPIELWTDEEVYNFLELSNVALPSHYTAFQSSGDCMTCSAWLGEGRGKYLEEHHPTHFIIYQARLNIIADAVEVHAENFKREIL